MKKVDVYSAQVIPLDDNGYDEAWVVRKLDRLGEIYEEVWLCLTKTQDVCACKKIDSRYSRQDDELELDEKWWHSEYLKFKEELKA